MRFSFKFGDSVELSDRLIQLVRAGKKTATCGALREYGSGKEEMPAVGRQDIALNWDDSPALLLETVEVQHLRFCDVDEYFALAEGENETLQGWQRDHKAYFERTGGFDPEMVLVCERFRLVRDLEADPD